MKTLRITVESLALIITFALFARAAAFSAETGPMKITEITGIVQVKMTPDGDWAPGKVNMTLPMGSTVRTGPNGYCTISWESGEAFVKPMTIMRADTIRSAQGNSSELSLAKGKAYFVAKKLETGNKSFNVKTPTAVAGVRGTKFSVDLTGGESEIIEGMPVGTEQQNAAAPGIGPSEKAASETKQTVSAHIPGIDMIGRAMEIVFIIAMKNSANPISGQQTDTNQHAVPTTVEVNEK